jgi:DNA-binding MarR family transcriptional regulator
MSNFEDYNKNSSEQNDNFKPMNQSQSEQIARIVADQVAIAMSEVNSRFANSTNNDGQKVNAKINTKIELEKENSLKQDVKYFYGFSANLIKLDLKPTEFKIIMHILETLKWGNVVAMTQASIAAKTGISASVVNRNWKTLIEKNVLIVDEHNSVLLNTNYFFVGLYQRMDKERREDFEKASVYDDVTITHMHNSAGRKV